MELELEVQKTPETPGEPSAKPPSASDGENTGRKGGDRTGDDARPGEDVKDLRKQLDRMREELRAVSESERYWAEKAKQSSAPPPAKSDEADDDGAEPDLDGDAIDLLSTKGLKALTESGFLTERTAKQLVKKTLEKQLATIEQRMAERAEQTLESRIQGLTKTASLVQRFPDLAVPESEFYQETQRELAALIEDEPELKGTNAAMRIAAEAAARRLNISERRQRQEERLDRIRRQAPERGGWRDGAADEVELSDTAALMVNRLGISPDKYLAEKRRLGGSNGGRR